MKFSVTDLIKNVIGVTFCLSICSYVQAEKPQKPLVLLPLAYYTPETSVAFGGLAIFNIDKVAEGKISNVLLSASYTVKQQTILIANPRFYFNEGRIEIFSSIRYMFFPSDYFGRGNETHKSDKSKFTQNTFATEIGVKHKIIGDFFFSPILGRNKQKLVNIEESTLMSEEVNNGFDDFEQFHTGLQAGFDTRDYPNAPLNGLYYFIQYTKNWLSDQRNLLQHKSYSGYDLDIRNYFPIWEKSVIATQFLFSRKDGPLIPFQFLNRLGLRGYLSSRFRDTTSALAQAELRSDVAEHWALATFFGAGVVGGTPETLTGNRKRVAGGIGAHYIPDPESRQKFRFDIGLGEGDYGVYVVFGEAF